MLCRIETKKEKVKTRKFSHKNVGRTTTKGNRNQKKCLSAMDGKPTQPKKECPVQSQNNFSELLSLYYTLGCNRNGIKILKTALGPLYPDSEMLIQNDKHSSGLNAGLEITYLMIVLWIFHLCFRCSSSRDWKETRLFCLFCCWQTNEQENDIFDTNFHFLRFQCRFVALCGAINFNINWVFSSDCSQGLRGFSNLLYGKAISLSRVLLIVDAS